MLFAIRTICIINLKNEIPMRKSLLMFVLILLTTLGLSAQHQTLFSGARVVGGFGAPIIEWGLGNNLTTSVGGGGGVVIDNVFIGGYGLGSVDFDALLDDDDIESLEIGHGGFWLGYTYRPFSVMHLYSSARIGWGVVDVQFDQNPTWDTVDKVFVLTPEIGAEVNLFRWFRVAGAVGYRWVNGVNENRGVYQEDDFNGAVATLTLRFGWFGRSR